MNPSQRKSGKRKQKDRTFNCRNRKVKFKETGYYLSRFEVDITEKEIKFLQELLPSNSLSFGLWGEEKFVFPLREQSSTSLISFASIEVPIKKLVLQSHSAYSEVVFNELEIMLKVFNKLVGSTKFNPSER